MVQRKLSLKKKNEKTLTQLIKSIQINGGKEMTESQAAEAQAALLVQQKE